MTANLTRYGRKAMLDHVCGRVAYPFPANVYLGLFTADPTETGALVNEVAVGGYARLEISDLMGSADLAARTIVNSADMLFAPVDAPVASITHFGVLDSATLGAGNMIWRGAPPTPRALGNGERLKIKTGQFSAALTLGIARYAAKAWLDHVFGRAPYAMPTPRLALFSAEPTEAGSLAAELSGGAYARPAIASLMADTVLVSGQIANAADIQFPDPSADWLPVVGCAIMDQETPGGGNMSLFTPFLAARMIYAGGEPFLIRSGELSFLTR